MTQTKTRTQETIEEKGLRYADEGAVTKLVEGVYEVRGSRPKPYKVRHGQCDCPAFSRCSHHIAAEIFAHREELAAIEAEAQVAQEQYVASWRHEDALVRIEEHLQQAVQEVEGLKKQGLRSMSATQFASLKSVSRSMQEERKHAGDAVLKAYTTWCRASRK